jgi:photosystem II stability/assembly factor-like uncharacterized protein
MNIFKKIILILLFVITSLFAQDNWEWQYSTTTEDLNDVYFINDNRGWAVGNNGTILRTVDGGKIWNQQNSNTTEKLRAVHFLNENLGWAVGINTMIFSEDGGISWSKYAQSAIKDIHCLFFTDEKNGWVCGTDSVILKTKDSGASWEIIHSRVSRFDAIFFLNDTLGWFHSGDDAGYIYRTADGGYSLKAMSRSRKTFISFFFIDSKRGWACGGVIGADRTIFGWIDLSTDGADNWNMQFEDGLIHSVHFFDENNGIALGQKNRVSYINKVYDVFYKTADGGENWESCEPGGNAFHFTDRNTGWIVGNLGKIYKTTSGGGILSVSSAEDTTFGDYILLQNHPNPFNQITILNYELRKTDEVELSVYNLLGQKIAILVSEKQSAGIYNAIWDAAGHSSGIYYCVLEVGGFHHVKKMILMR